MATKLCSGTLAGGAVSYSSYWNGDHLGWRLHSLAFRDEVRGAWSAGQNVLGEWIQVATVIPQWWTAVDLQGRQDVDQWVTKYKIQTSMDGITFTDVANGKEFPGCTSRGNVVRTTFPPVFARVLRIVPTAWVNHISLRFDAYFVDSN
eukprot:TRINITY_DN14306_c0_g1_i1.p1 TRINITY_DN14306_c0_g1~~TRINITY_DN14306_c0_g1_i1.p1  ORF type:complete len:148 (-),score=19.48 TRINITY_DN14306_c0_g1_i1:25-468(-)